MIEHLFDQVAGGEKVVLFDVARDPALIAGRGHDLSSLLQKFHRTPDLSKAFLPNISKAAVETAAETYLAIVMNVNRRVAGPARYFRILLHVK